MNLPFCKICGMNHRLGFCPLFQEVPKIAPVSNPPSEQSGASRAGDGVRPRIQELPATEAVPGDVPPSHPRRRGRPLQSNVGNSLAAQQPWKSEGMSRATWFRRQHA